MCYQLNIDSILIVFYKHMYMYDSFQNIGTLYVGSNSVSKDSKFISCQYIIKDTMQYIFSLVVSHIDLLQISNSLKLQLCICICDIHVYICVHTYVYMCIYMCIYVYICVYVCMYDTVCMKVGVCVYIVYTMV